jgi:glycosyltransferase involved in cell wall biosynthesis
MTSRRLRLAWITPTYQLDADDFWSPGLTALAHRLAEQHDLVVYSLRSRGGLTRFRVGQVEVRAFAAGPPAGLRAVERLGPLVRAISSLMREPADRRPDVVHAIWATEPALAGAIAAPLIDRPLLVSSMGGEPASLPAIGFGGARTIAGRVFLGAGVAAAHTITCGSKWHSQVLRARIGCAKPIAVMPLGVDFARFARPSDPFPRPLAAPARLLTVGSLLPVKGHRLLIEALPILLPRLPPDLRGLCLRIVGEGPERPALETLISRLGLGARVKLAGQVGYRAMPAEYAAADLFVLSSHYESQCLALVEALASGLPAVSTAVGLAPELLADRQAGELAPEISREGLASALERLLLRRDTWPELQSSAQEVALPFANDRTTSKWVDLYRQIAERTGSKGRARM